jgi:pre-mRNA-splicing factor 38B
MIANGDQSNEPSSAWCLLFRLFCFRLCEKEMLQLINHKDSVYIRALGFIYLR